MRSQSVLCPRCKKKAQFKFVVTEHEMNRVPRWRKKTLCCGSYVGDVEFGYSSPDGKSHVSPQFGLVR